MALAVAAPASAAELPDGFEEVALASQLDTPTAVDWAPDGRMFVVEKAGVLKVVTPARAPQAEVVLDLSERVNSYGDRGLLGVAVARDFVRTGHVYLLYTYEVDPALQDGRKSARLTRVTVGPDNRLRGDEAVILGRQGSRPCRRRSNTRDCIPADGPLHTIGTVRAARDGTLWVGTGDSTSTYDDQYENSFDAYRNDSFAGKLIHVDARGRGLRGHPFCRRDRNLAHVCTKLHAKGFRNPFRFTLWKGRPIVGDLGLENREEIDAVLPGRNYGWPCFEGSIRTPAFRRNRLCRPWFARSGARRGPVAPLYDYSGQPGGVVVGPVFRGRRWPARYRGQLFFADYARSFISTLDLRSAVARPFARRLSYPVALEQTPPGDLAYVDAGRGQVRAIRWSPANRTPIPRATTDRTSGAVPLTVRFSGARSADPDGDALSYHWDFGDGDSAEGSGVEHRYTRAGNFVVRLTVRDPHGRGAVELIEVTPGNTPPEVTLERPRDGALYRAGGPVALRARATDSEDGALADQAITWEATLDHRGHSHFVLAGMKGAVAGFTAASDHSADSFFEVTVTARDSGGLEARRTVTIRPRTATVRVASKPRGAPITFAGRGARAPATSTEAVGFETAVAAARSFSRRGRRYRFSRWSDGGRREHVVAVKPDGLRLRAVYRRARP